MEKYSSLIRFLSSIYFNVTFLLLLSIVLLDWQACPDVQVEIDGSKFGDTGGYVVLGQTGMGRVYRRDGGKEDCGPLVIKPLGQEKQTNM